VGPYSPLHGRRKRTWVIPIGLMNFSTGSERDGNRGIWETAGASRARAWDTRVAASDT
jgi:hypothetical protein